MAHDSKSHGVYGVYGYDEEKKNRDCHKIGTFKGKYCNVGLGAIMLLEQDSGYFPYVQILAAWELIGLLPKRTRSITPITFKRTPCCSFST